MSASLDLYRQLIPGHANVPAASIEVWLAMAAARHSAAAFGAGFAAAMVFWAAAGLDPMVQAGLVPLLDGSVCAGPAKPSGKSVMAQKDSVYWAFYLDIRDSRSASSPRHVGLPTEGWPTVGWPWPV